MAYVDVGTANSRTTIYYKDWGAGRPILFCHGWPLSSDAFEDQMLVVAQHGFRAIAHDRRGHGRSSQPWYGNDMDTYADDLHALIEHLDLHDVTLVGHSTGGGEVARYIGRHGTKRIAQSVLIGAITPALGFSSRNPNGVPMKVFDELRDNVQKDRSQLFKDMSPSFYGANRTGASVSAGVLDFFWLQGMMAGLQNVYQCIKVFSETDLTDDLKKFDIPTLLLHGDDDQICPIDITARRAVKLIASAQLNVYSGAPHGLCSTHKDQISADILAFIK